MGTPGPRATHAMLLLAALTGLLTGLGVTLFEWLAREQLFDWLAHRDRWMQATGPLVGLLLAAACLRWLAGGASASTADEYVINFHDHNRWLDQRPVLGRLAASVATLGLGEIGRAHV